MSDDRRVTYEDERGNVFFDADLRGPTADVTQDPFANVWEDLRRLWKRMGATIARANAE